jgi:hypothetical protein
MPKYFIQVLNLEVEAETREIAGKVELEREVNNEWIN